MSWSDAVLISHALDIPVDLLAGGWVCSVTTHLHLSSVGDQVGVLLHYVYLLERYVPHGFYLFEHRPYSLDLSLREVAQIQIIHRLGRFFWLRLLLDQRVELYGLHPFTALVFIVSQERG